MDSNVTVQFVDSEGNKTGQCYRLPLSITTTAMSKIINTYLEKDNETKCLYTFFITNDLKDVKTEFSSGIPILSTIQNTINSSEKLQKIYQLTDNDGKISEILLIIAYHPQSRFKVKPVTRCTASMSGHKSQVLAISFSADGRYLVSGSADGVIKFWDLNLQASKPLALETTHPGMVFFVKWSPNGKMLASSCSEGCIYTWVSDKSGKWAAKCGPLRKKMAKQKKVKDLSWKPLHLDGHCRYLAASYEDSTVVIWDVVKRLPFLHISGHNQPVRAMSWSGENLLYCACQDGMVKVWNPEDGTLKWHFSAHKEWINTISLNTDFAIRTGAFDPMNTKQKQCFEKMTPEELQEEALHIYKRTLDNKPERMVVCSDDKTLSLWTPSVSDKPICDRMLGHQHIVWHAKFSPNGLFIASAGFDKSIRIWDGMTGKFLERMEGHFNIVYGISWASDSRYLVSCSRDSTVKLWSMEQVRGLTKPIEKFALDAKLKKKITAPNCKRVRISHLYESLPGHRDQVNCLDWSPDSQTVASGGKDCIVKLWRS